MHALIIAKFQFIPDNTTSFNNDRGVSPFVWVGVRSSSREALNDDSLPPRWMQDPIFGYLGPLSLLG
jgi:hypothetical protein